MAKTEERTYVIKNPDAPASSRQTYAIYLMSGVDVRELGLTKQQASDHIDGLKNGKPYHVRLALAQAGGVVKTRDVNKNLRDATKPKGYVTSMKKHVVTGKPKTKAPAKKKATKKANPLDDIDWNDPKVQRIMEAFKAAGV